ncbi:MAG: hypothetical protein Hens3KO_14910 [Henriciella sp.]
MRKYGIICIALLGAVLPAEAWRFESGRTVLNNTATTPTHTSVTFQTPFDSIPVVVALPTNDGTDPSDLRISNISLTGFDVMQVEPEGNDGTHDTMTIDYVAAEPGQHTLPGGSMVIVDRVTTATYQAGGGVGGPEGWDPQTFPTAFTAAPIVLAEIQSVNSETGTPPSGVSEPWLSATVGNLAATGFDLALERSEVNTGTVVAETIGYIAVETATGDFISDTNTTIDWSAHDTGRIVRGWNNGCYTSPFSTTAWTNARVIATKSSHYGGDGGWVRRCSLTPTQVGLTIDEDINRDTERNHTTENVSILAFSDSFHANFVVNLGVDKNVAVMEDPINGTTDPFMISGSRVRYTIDFESLGNLSPDSDTLNFVDEIPADMSLIVSDIAGVGDGPVLWSDGSPSSDLTYTFTSLASTSDDVAFSNDGGATFVYTPVPLADGSDPAVTHISVSPKGTFAYVSGAGTPTFSLAMDMIVE